MPCLDDKTLAMLAQPDFDPAESARSESICGPASAVVAGP